MMQHVDAPFEYWITPSAERCPPSLASIRLINALAGSLQDECVTLSAPSPFSRACVSILFGPGW